jgi:phage terminase small subunit
VGLTKKRRVFVEEYLRCWNATEAARRAGYAHPEVMGCRLRKVNVIADLIQERIAEKAMTADEVLLRLAEQARAEHSKYLTSDGVNVKDLLRDGKGHLVKGIKPTRYGDDIEFYDAQAALVHIGKHLGLFREQVEHSGSIGVRHEPVSLDDITDEELDQLARLAERLTRDSSGETEA